MMSATQVEELICLVSAMDRPQLIRRFGGHRAGFPVDFTSDFLNTLPLERLRHIFVALCLQSKQQPTEELLA